MDPEDFDTYEPYEGNPYDGTDQDGADFDTFVEEDADEPTDEEIAEWEAREEREDAGLDAMMEDRISGFSGFEADY
jgi:hypothetical protein